VNGRQSLCELCIKHGACQLETLPGIRTVECFKFEAVACERCKKEQPQRACRPPACLGEEVPA
jgi:hypothetical protein